MNSKIYRRLHMKNKEINEYLRGGKRIGGIDVRVGIEIKMHYLVNRPD